MDELKRILDDILSKSLDVRPEVQWLQKQHLLFMKKNGLTAKRMLIRFCMKKCTLPCRSRIRRSQRSDSGEPGIMSHLTDSSF